MKLTLAITGASGTVYAYRTLRLLLDSGGVSRINLILSDVVPVVARVEMGADLRQADPRKVNAWLGLEEDSKVIRLWGPGNFAAKPSSGSYAQEGMIIVPCSMATAGAIASGAGTNLIHRAADVTLKEGRRLVLVPRETPLSAIHLENLLKLKRAGATILPAAPGFYHRPDTIEELVDHLCYRILDQFGLHHSRGTQWEGGGEE